MNLPGPNEMPEEWFARFVAAIPVPRYLYGEDRVRWRNSWRPLATSLWATAWVAGSAWTDAHGRLPPRTVMMVDEELIGKFREQLGGLPDGAPEG